jgi:hypothetical protein
VTASAARSCGSLTEEAAKQCVVSLCRVGDVTFLEEVANDVGLLLSPMELPADRGQHVGASLWATLPQGVGIDVLVEQFIGMEFRTVPRELNQADLVGVGGECPEAS